MTKKKLSQSMKYKNILKGRLFEFVIKHLFDRAGFVQDIISDQFTVTGARKRLHGRGATYDPDYYGALKIGIPFLNPIMVVVEAKFFKNKVNIKVAREFLGASVDFMQYYRINTKQSGKNRYNDMILPRFQHCPIIISRKGFDSNAKGLLYAHGIRFIGYDDSGIFSTVTEKLDNFLKYVNFSNFNQDSLRHIVSLESLTNLDSNYIKPGYMRVLSDLTSYINSIDSTMAVLGYQHTVNVVIYPSYHSKKPRYKTKFKLRYVSDGLFFIVRANSKTLRSKLGEFYFPISKSEYDRISRKEGLLASMFSNISVINDDGISNIKLPEGVIEELLLDLASSFNLEQSGETPNTSTS